MLALVGRHPPDEEPLRPLPPPAQPVERRPVRRAVVLVQVDQERAHEGAFVAAVDQLFFVVGRVGEGKGGVGGQHVQLLAGVVHGQGDVRLPPGEVRGGRDVVVVAEQLLAGPGPGPEPTGHGRAGGHLVDEEAVLAGQGAVLLVGPRLPAQVAQDVLGPDVAAVTRFAQHAAHLEGVVADGVVRGKAGQVQVNPHRMGLSLCSAWPPCSQLCSARWWRRSSAPTG